MDIIGKKVLVTGSEGFIGSHLVEQLVEEGCIVRAFVFYNFKNDWGWLEDLKCLENVEVFVGDVRDFQSVYESMKDIDIVFHLAALIGIPYSYKSPLSYIHTNIIGTYNVLESAKMHNTKRVIITSTSETYGSAQYIPMDEKHPVVGQSPYSATKIAADQLAISYFKSFNLPVIIARPFNAYGPRQSARAVIPTIISTLLKDKELKLGNLYPTRDFNFVEDTASGMIFLAKCEKNIFGEIINIGSNNEISIGELVNLIANILGKQFTISEDDSRIRKKESEVNRLRCNNNKLKSLGWESKVELKEGLMKTIEYIKQNLHHYKDEVYNL